MDTADKTKGAVVGKTLGLFMTVLKNLNSCLYPACWDDYLWRALRVLFIFLALSLVETK